MTDVSHIKINNKDYKIIGKIGMGSFGVVYKAEQFPSNKCFAIKVQQKIDQNEKRTINLFIGKTFKNLVNIFEYEEKKDSIYIVMEYCSQSLYDKINFKTISPYEIRYIMKQILNGLEELHLQLKLAHRDIKPENILIYELKDQGTSQSQEIYKICDFGCSKEQNRLGTKFVGTAYYLAPEQISNDQKFYSTSVDIWAFGAVMYELFTKTPLFNGASEIQIFNQIQSLNIDQKIDDLQNLELKYKELLKKMLARNEKERASLKDIKQVVDDRRSQSVDKKLQFKASNQDCNQIQQLNLKQPKVINQSSNQNNYFFPKQQQPNINHHKNNSQADQQTQLINNENYFFKVYPRMNNNHLLKKQQFQYHQEPTKLSQQSQSNQIRTSFPNEKLNNQQKQQ